MSVKGLHDVCAGVCECDTLGRISFLNVTNYESYDWHSQGKNEMEPN